MQNAGLAKSAVISASTFMCLSTQGLGLLTIQNVGSDDARCGTRQGQQAHHLLQPQLQVSGCVYGSAAEL